MSKITHNGQSFDFDAAVNLMDADLCDQIHSSIEDGTTDQQFFDLYAAAHAEKFGEEFVIN